MRTNQACSSGPLADEREERQPDRHREQPEQPERLADLRRPAPSARDVQRQQKARDGHHDQMDDDRRAARREARQQMRIGIAGEQRGLEEHHRHRPHRRGAAEPRQHHLGEHRLHREQQRGADENGGDEGRQQQTRAMPRRALALFRSVGSSDVLMSLSFHCSRYWPLCCWRPEDRGMAWTLPFPPHPRKPQAVPIGKHAARRHSLRQTDSMETGAERSNERAASRPPFYSLS